MITRYNSHQNILKELPKIISIKRIIEFGSGVYSTPLFLEYPLLDYIISYETDKEWFSKVKSTIMNNKNKDKCFLILSDSLKKNIFNENLDSYDLIFIDDSSSGKERIETIKTICNKKPKSLVLIHDYDYKFYRDVANFEHEIIYKPNRCKNDAWVGILWNGNLLSEEQIKKIKEIK